MLQRIQTVYLAVAVLLMTPYAFLSVTWTSRAAETLPWFTPAVLALAAAVALTAGAAIALYANRTRQRGVVLGAQAATVALFTALTAGLYFASGLTLRTAGAYDPAKVAAMVIPIVTYVLLVLARRAIEKDIELVRSMDRLR